MSDLSFLIQNQNQVVIDQNYLQKCLQSNQQQQIKKISSGLSQNLPSNKIKPNKTKTHVQFKDKYKLKNENKNIFCTQNDQKKFSTQSSDTTPQEKEEISKISMRIEALQENQKRLQQRIGVDLFQIKQNLVKWSREQNYQVEHVKRIKSEVNETKEKIANLLTLISTQPN